jgi:ribosomal protein S19E (S16A)
LGVRLFSRLNEIGGLRIGQEGVYLTPAGAALLQESGLASCVDGLDEVVGRLCIDWTERQTHLSGKLGRYLLEQLLGTGWVRTDPKSRALQVLPAGTEGLTALGIQRLDLN